MLQANQKRVRCFSIKKIDDQSTAHTNARNVAKKVENGTIKSAQHRIKFKCFVMKVEKERVRTRAKERERKGEKERMCVSVCLPTIRRDCVNQIKE